MATILKNRLQFTNIGAGATSTQAHGANLNGTPKIPDHAEVDNGNFAITACDDVNITVQNNGPAAANCAVLVEYWHTIERTFGNDNILALPNPPFIPAGGNATSGIGTGLRLDNAGSFSVNNAYIDAANGNDNNDGLTPATALRTFAGLYRRFPWEYAEGSSLVVNLAGVGGFGAAATATLDYLTHSIYFGCGTNHPSIFIQGPSFVPGVLATGSNTPTLAVVPTVRVNEAGAPDVNGQRTRFDFVAAGWTVDDLGAKPVFLEIRRAGQLVLWQLPIERNDASALYINVPIAPGTVLSTDTVRIVQPGANIIGQNDVPDGRNVYIYGHAGQFPFISYAGGGFRQVSFGFGVTGQVITFAQVQGMCLDRVAFRNTNTYFIGGSSDQLLTKYCANTPGLVTIEWSTFCGGQDLFPRNIGPTTDYPIADTIFNSITAFNSNGFNIGSELFGPGRLVLRRAMSVAGTNFFPSITVNSGSLFRQLDPSAPVTGTSAVGGQAGIKCVNGGQAIIIGDSGGVRYTSITSGGGDLKVGNDATPIINYGAAAGQFQDVASWNGNFFTSDLNAGSPIGDFSRISRF